MTGTLISSTYIHYFYWIIDNNVHVCAKALDATRAKRVTEGRGLHPKKEIGRVGLPKKAMPRAARNRPEPLTWEWKRRKAEH